MLRTKTILIPKIKKISLNYINNYFTKHNIEPIRWAICEVKDDCYVIKASVALVDYMENN